MHKSMLQCCPVCKLPSVQSYTLSMTACCGMPIQKPSHTLQISKATSASDTVSKQLAETQQALSDRTDQLAKATASLEAREAELGKLSQQHQALMVQHERTEGELSDLAAVLKQKQKDGEAVQQM